MAITINGTSGISGVDGSAATPALQGTDTNTGISFGTDEVNINTGGTTRATVDSNGRLLVGTSSSTSNTRLVIQGATGNTSGEGIIRFARGEATPADGASTGAIIFTDSSHGDGALINGARDGGTWSASSKPSRLVFSTTADGASLPTERVRITSTGDLQFNSGYGSVATAYGVRAWINFQGNAATIGTGRASGNMDAVTDNGTGRYTLNFTNDMPDDDYAAFGNCAGTTSANGDESKITFNSGAYLTGSLGVRVVDSVVDALVVNICIIR